MLPENTRRAIIELRHRGWGIRKIARELKVSRTAVRAVLKAGSADVSPLSRDELAEPYRDRIVTLLDECEGNLVRVHEEIVEQGCHISYQALTSFCRRHEIGKPPRQPAGRYTFAPGQEMQHDTSPHRLTIGGRKCLGQTASVVLCYSRMMFVQIYPNFRRFECKTFLVDAVQYFGGACKTAMIDNTHVVVLRGTGAKMIPVPEMEVFAGDLGFAFAAHEVGDANRSARVERPFHFIENNFLAGRKFEDWAEVNREAITWCNKKNAMFRRSLHAAPRELFVAEKLAMQPLPAWIAPPYLLHHRVVDLEGYVSVASNRYSVPWKLIGRRLEVRETKDEIEAFDGPRIVATHDRLIGSAGKRIFKLQHRPPRERKKAPSTPREERALLVLVPQLETYVTQLKLRARGNTTLAIRRLLAMAREYPREPFCAALADAATYGLYEMHRVERMILRRVATDFFQMGNEQNEPHQEHDDDGTR